MSIPWFSSLYSQSYQKWGGKSVPSMRPAIPHQPWIAMLTCMLYVHMFVYASLCMCMHGTMLACIHDHPCMYLCIYVFMRLCVYVFMCLCIYVFMYLCVDVFMNL